LSDGFKGGDPIVQNAPREAIEERRLRGAAALNRTDRPGERRSDSTLKACSWKQEMFDVAFSAVTGSDSTARAAERTAGSRTSNRTPASG
jgi:hypothetical protein